jgi:hypothetical protein
MRYVARVPIDYIRQGTGELCERLEIRLTPVLGGTQTMVEGSVFSLISFFTALANHYRLTLADIKEKFA